MKIPLHQQIEELDRELASRRSSRSNSLTAYQTRRLEAARATLAWLAEHETLVGNGSSQWIVVLSLGVRLALVWLHALMVRNHLRNRP